MFVLLFNTLYYFFFTRFYYLLSYFYFTRRIFRIAHRQNFFFYPLVYMYMHALVHVHELGLNNYGVTFRVYRFCLRPSSFLLHCIRKFYSVSYNILETSKRPQIEDLKILEIIFVYIIRTFNVKNKKSQLIIQKHRNISTCISIRIKYIKIL